MSQMKHGGVQGGTKGGETLCKTCRYATCIQGRSETQYFLYCNSLEEKMSFEAVECSLYDDKRLPALHEMKSVAWILRTTLSNPIGFVSPQEWRNKYRKEDNGPDY